MKNEYVQFDLVKNDIPQSAFAFIKECNADRSHCAKIQYAFYKGNVETTKDWVLVFNDGWYYKVKAKYMTWFRNSKGEIIGKCNWSQKWLNTTLMAIFNDKVIPNDPGYQS